MRKQHITPEHVRRIFEMYNEILGPSNVHFLDPKKVSLEIQANSFDTQYKVGSRWNLHSILAFYPDLSKEDEIVVTFFPVPGGFENTVDEAYDKGEEFETKVREYLKEEETERRKRRLS